jgi:glycosyltransferase involved in cell wall biosynthesis
MKPLVSILIPAYNAEAWIAGTIKSALAQTWPRKEMIIVDDGSTDQTFAVTRWLASKDVAVVTRENQFLSGEAGNCAGVGKARHESSGAGWRRRGLVGSTLGSNPSLAGMRLRRHKSCCRN